MKNYVKIMREMLKRRQFIFGKQNINRHQPYLDDVVINVSGEGDVDAVMKFAPTKKEVIDIIKSYFSDQDSVVFNISEEDVEFVDTFLYKQDDYDHIGYIYKLTKGSAADEDLSGRRIACAGPILALDGKVALVVVRSITIADHDYLYNVFGDGGVSDPALPNGLMDGTMRIVTDLETPDPAMPITELPDPSYIVNITTDVLPYIIDHVYLYLSGGK